MRGSSLCTVDAKVRVPSSSIVPKLVTFSILFKTLTQSRIIIWRFYSQKVWSWSFGYPTSDVRWKCSLHGDFNRANVSWWRRSLPRAWSMNLIVPLAQIHNLAYKTLKPPPLSQCGLSIHGSRRNCTVYVLHLATILTEGSTTCSTSDALHHHLLAPVSKPSTSRISCTRLTN